MPDIYDLAAQFRRQLLAHDREAAAELIGYYGEVYRRLRQRIDVLLRQIADARAAGEEVSPAWLFQAERMQALLDQVAAEMRRFADAAGVQITEAQRQAVALAEAHAEQLALTGLGKPPPGVLVTWSRLPREAMTDLVGFLQEGSPLRALLDELGPEASRGVREALVVGIATGQNPRTMARQIKRALGGNLVRALTISRTEVLRSYREATRRSYQANRDVVKGWIWHAHLDTRTCAACWAMHGTTHNLDERLDDHPNGRCAMLPWLKTWAELGIKGIEGGEIEVGRGEALFDALSAKDQQRVLGKKAFEAYNNLQVDLRDFVGRKRDPHWGTMRYRLPLHQALKHSDMPDVKWGVERSQAQPVADVRQAIRIFRDAGVSLRGQAITLQGDVTNYFGAVDPNNRSIIMWNNTSMVMRDRDHWQHEHETHGVSVRLFNSAAERFAETLAHEYGHVLTLQREGNYPSEGMTGLPNDLYRRIVDDLFDAGRPQTWYNVGEVIADDVRRVLLGRDTRLNYMTFRADSSDVDSAWQRAQEVWRWLTTR